MNKIINIFIRYLFLVLIAIPDLYLFYLIFTPLTVYPSYFLLNLFFDVYLAGSTIVIAKLNVIDIIPACIAGSAYYLLVILNLSIPDIKLKKRIKMITFGFTLLLILNILRIFSLSIMFTTGSPLFDITHKIFWYFLSILFVVAIWFAEVKAFKIKQIPVYTDLKFLKKKANNSKTS